MHNALTMLIFSRTLRRAALAALIFPVISVSAHAQGNAADEIERFMFVRRAREAQKKETRDPLGDLFRGNAAARSECALLFRPVAAKMTAELRARSARRRRNASIAAATRPSRPKPPSKF